MTRRYTGDEEPPLKIVLSGSDPVDLSAASSIRVIGRQDGEILFDRAPTTSVVDGDNWLVTMNFQSADLLEPGRIQVEVEVTWPSNRQETFRADGGVDVWPDFDLVP